MLHLRGASRQAARQRLFNFVRRARVGVWEMGVSGYRHIVCLGTALLLGSPALAADLQTPDASAPLAIANLGAARGHDGQDNDADAAPGGGLFAGSPLTSSFAAASGAAPGAPVVKFRSERDAFRTGIRDYYSGDKASAVQALEYAATRGHSPAQWKLGRMYAEGDGVPHDDLKAFEYFSKVVEGSEDNPRRAVTRFISNAYVALGGYYLDGIAGSYVQKDERRAREMFHHAASYYGDPDAQYNLARLCLAGQGGPRDAQLAARWLHLAAEKNHAPSQALLGHLLLTGQGNVARQTSRGLMWLTIARNSADPQKDAWIIEMYEQAIALAPERDRNAAQATAQAYMAQRSGRN